MTRYFPRVPISGPRPANRAHSRSNLHAEGGYSLPDKYKRIIGLLRVPEAAEVLHLKPSTIRAWLLRRKLPCVHCGRAVRIPVDALEKFIAENTVPAKRE